MLNSRGALSLSPAFFLCRIHHRVPGLLDYPSSDGRLRAPCPVPVTTVHSPSLSPPFFPRFSLPRLPMHSALPSGLFCVYPLSSGTRLAPAFPVCFGSTSPVARLRRLPWIFQKKRRSGGKVAPSGETVGGGSPGAWGSEVEGSTNARTGTSGTGGGPSHWARVAGAEGRNTEVAPRQDSLPPACHQALPLLVALLFLLISGSPRLP